MDLYQFKDYALSVGRQGLILFIMYTFYGQFIPCSFERNYAQIRVKTKIVCFAECVIIFKFVFLE